MKLFRSWFYLTMAVLAALSAPAQSRSSRNRVYDPATETTIKGSVEQVSQPSRGQISGIHIFVKTDGSTTEVALGPSTFVGGKGFSFAKGNSVEVTGSKVTISGKDYIVAREVVKDGKHLTLRDKDGTPEWAVREGNGRAPIESHGAS